MRESSTTGFQEDSLAPVALSLSSLLSSRTIDLIIIDDDDRLRSRVLRSLHLLREGAVSSVDQHDQDRRDAAAAAGRIRLNEGLVGEAAEGIRGRLGPNHLAADLLAKVRKTEEGLTRRKRRRRKRRETSERESEREKRDCQPVRSRQQ
jgi:hypothetical protein